MLRRPRGRADLSRDRRNWRSVSRQAQSTESPQLGLGSSAIWSSQSAPSLSGARALLRVRKKTPRPGRNSTCSATSTLPQGLGAERLRAAFTRGGSTLQGASTWPPAPSPEWVAQGPHEVPTPRIGCGANSGANSAAGDTTWRSHRNSVRIRTRFRTTGLRAHSGRPWWWTSERGPWSSPPGRGRPESPASPLPRGRRPRWLRGRRQARPALGEELAPGRHADGRRPACGHADLCGELPDEAQEDDGARRVQGAHHVVREALLQAAVPIDGGEDVTALDAGRASVWGSALSSSRGPTEMQLALASRAGGPHNALLEQRI